MSVRETMQGDGRIEERFQTERLLPVIARRLEDCRERLELTGGLVLGIRLKPGLECAGHLDLSFRVRETGADVRQTVLVHLTDLAPRPVTDPGGVEAYRALGLPIRTIMTELPELSAVMIPAALDPGLPSLAEALDRQAMKRRLKPVVQNLLGPEPVVLTGVRPRLISHAPGARATIRYRLWVADAWGTPVREISVIGKLNAHRELARTMADNHALWECAADRFQQARPLGTIQSLGLSLQTMIEGERLNEHATSDRFPGFLRDVGHALAAFHRAPLPLERMRDPQREIASLSNRGRLLSAVTREPARVDRLAGGLAEAVSAHCRVTGPVHGDFHHANVMVNDSGIALIDFDEMGLGDPALDVGRFLASLSVPSLRFFGDLRLLGLGRDHFLAGYLAETDIDVRRVRIFEAVGFIISALTLWRLNRAGSGAPVDGLIDLAEEALADVHRRPPRGRSDKDLRPLRQAELRRWAGDPIYLAQLMKPAVHRLHGAEIHRAEATVVSERGRTLRLSCKIHGKCAAGRWQGRAEGISSPGLRTRAVGRMRDHLRAALGEDADALAIPELLGMNQRLGLLLWERPAARQLAAGEGPAARGTAVRLARALARLHRFDDGSDSRPTVAGFLERRGKPDLGELGLDPAEPLVASLAEPRLPHFADLGERIVVLRPDKLRLAPALLGVAELTRDIEERAGAGTAVRFRDEYLAAAGRSSRDLEAWTRLVQGRAPGAAAT